MSKTSDIRIFSVDDHPLLRHGIAMVINNQPDMLWAKHLTDAKLFNDFGNINPMLLSWTSDFRI